MWLRAGVADLSRETAVAFARSCPRRVETLVSFAGRSGEPVETAIAFAVEKWAFLVRFLVAEVLSVSTVAVQGRAVVVVSYWPASAAAAVFGGFKFLVIAACRGGTGFICQLPELWDGSLVAPWCSGCRRARPSAKPAGPCCAVGGGSPASRPRRELRSARRLVVRPGPAAARGHRSKAQAARGGLELCTVSRR